MSGTNPQNKGGALAQLLSSDKKSTPSVETFADNPSGRWILVPAGEQEKSKSDVKDCETNRGLNPPSLVREVTPAVMPTASSLALHTALRGSKGKLNAPIKVVLWQEIAQSQSTTALVTASALQPSSGLQYSSFALVYDLCRCSEIEFRSKASDGSLPGVSSWGIAFDPSASGNLSSIVQVLEQRQHLGPITLSSGASGAPTQAVASSTGFHSWKGKPEKTFVSSTTNDFIGSNWYPTSYTSAIVGYLKPYVQNASGGTVYQTTYVGYHMEFKIRG